MMCCNVYTPPVLETICKDKVYDKARNIIYNNACDLKPIGKVKNGKIYWFKNK